MPALSWFGAFCKVLDGKSLLVKFPGGCVVAFLDKMLGHALIFSFVISQLLTEQKEAGLRKSCNFDTSSLVL